MVYEVVVSSYVEEKWLKDGISHKQAREIQAAPQSSTPSCNSWSEQSVYSKYGYAGQLGISPRRARLIITGEEMSSALSLEVCAWTEEHIQGRDCHSICILDASLLPKHVMSGQGLLLEVSMDFGLESCTHHRNIELRVRGRQTSKE
ncbi:hypothetical protein H112_01191 [Trichophyton rubrum D6]|uniref:Uncharacterized protein n=1 Tax=Trichophyton rubrum CBS 288.86 TaxID=1215330 RepID=A0A022WD47_TRIRU|nr:hypothetical protein H100_01184 [Trichophyton rubrum MR850]EZF45746.1 hypothetical protein H102_01181 [Trichophyton rubrum CBS 100081]EZF56320.1 hypothetical protein H103_01188 [Trichophyton rubrum CBS 288.86]EZF67067.1 hypothetical protein H104_01174 [Trichophyton rubrum CBS 289.86]EZF88248.1 hypothetical protein H110_01191 [Trichophyton rubrum MR1448]EZF99080.1 hypothetical protein H113_01190 [Trichophyton rubrum MR1459]EZG20648.1 hypothetical protein H107_01239 [Trichophyton rubrum CBS 